MPAARSARLHARRATGCAPGTDGRRARHRARAARRSTLERCRARARYRRASARRARGPVRQERQPRAKDRGLHLVEPRVHAELAVVIAIGLAAVAQALARARRSRVVVGRQRAAVAERAEILRRVEAVRRGGAEAADRPAPARGEVRLAAVLDDGEAVPRGDRGDRRHVGRLAVEVHGHDRGGARRDRRGDGRRIERQPHPGRCRRTPGRAPAIMIASAV